MERNGKRAGMDSKSSNLKLSTILVKRWLHLCCSPTPPPAASKLTTVLLQAWCWARPHLLLLWRTPLWWGMWPLWLWLPWFSAAQLQAALHSTLPLARPVHRDHSTTTVSQWQGHLTTRQYFRLFMMIDRGEISFRLSANPCSWDTFHAMLTESKTT